MNHRPLKSVCDSVVGVRPRVGLELNLPDVLVCLFLCSLSFLFIVTFVRFVFLTLYTVFLLEWHHLVCYCTIKQKKKGKRRKRTRAFIFKAGFQKSNRKKCFFEELIKHRCTQRKGGKMTNTGSGK